MSHLCTHDLCNGCWACANICPMKCIRMEKDAEGFFRPIVDESQCVKCGRCNDICPVLHLPALQKEEPKCYAAMNRSEAQRANASSGGVFILLARWVIDRGGVVFGAAFDADFSVSHQSAETLEEAKAFCGSKYLQSRIGNVYQQAKRYLKENRWVLFTGTPCQILGLRAFLGEDSPRLLTMDIVCHGVPSPDVWQRYISFRACMDNQGKPPQRICFRSKTSGWSKYSVVFQYDNSDYRVPYACDPFMRGFLHNLYLRPSCHQCIAKGINRAADFTLADFWGIQNCLPHMDDDRGTSLVLIHSEKGHTIWSEIENQIVSEAIEPEKALIYNSSATESSAVHPNRSRFFNSYQKNANFPKLIQKLVPDEKKPSIIRRVLSKIKRTLLAGIDGLYRS